MVYFKVFGNGFLILGSHERAYDLFERRSTNYSDRPRLVMLNELFVNSRYMLITYAEYYQNGLGLRLRIPTVWKPVEATSSPLS
jgi:hypothetical protein